MKMCASCQEMFEFSGFYVKGRSKSGASKLSSVCKKCHNKKVIEWQKKNKEKVRSYVRKSCKKAYDANPEKYKEKTTQRRLKDPVAYKMSVSKSYFKKQLNLDEAEILRRRKNANTWRKANPEIARMRVKMARERHPQRHARYQSTRRANKMQATPLWLTPIQLAQIQEFFDICSAVSMQTGIKHHVDHICPLLGKNVRGLHVPWNLQVIPAVENIRKSNRIEGA